VHKNIRQDPRATVGVSSTHLAFDRFPCSEPLRWNQAFQNSARTRAWRGAKAILLAPANRCCISQSSSQSISMLHYCRGRPIKLTEASECRLPDFDATRAATRSMPKTRILCAEEMKASAKPEPNPDEHSEERATFDYYDIFHRASKAVR
jgi:hypothetical protein